jgi:23S rRNA (adenine2503-C2)-methyltransferase
VHLALSLHSAIQEKRASLMPIGQKHTLGELSKAILEYHQITARRITIEYLLLGQQNDSDRDAEALAVFCRSFPVKVNLIEYNSFPGSPFRAPDAATTQRWMQFLQQKNMVVNLRKSKGADIAAACGQLAGMRKNNNTK